MLPAEADVELIYWLSGLCPSVTLQVWFLLLWWASASAPVNQHISLPTDQSAQRRRGTLIFTNTRAADQASHLWLKQDKRSDTTTTTTTTSDWDRRTTVTHEHTTCKNSHTKRPRHTCHRHRHITAAVDAALTVSEFSKERHGATWPCHHAHKQLSLSVEGLMFSSWDCGECYESKWETIKKKMGVNLIVKYNNACHFYLNLENPLTCTRFSKTVSAGFFVHQDFTSQVRRDETRRLQNGLNKYY